MPAAFPKRFVVPRRSGSRAAIEAQVQAQAADRQGGKPDGRGPALATVLAFSEHFRLVLALLRDVAICSPFFATLSKKASERWARGESAAHLIKVDCAWQRGKRAAIMADWLMVAAFFVACGVLNWLGPKLDAELWVRRWSR